MQDAVTTPQWEEENSQDFIDYGKYFVPDREIQINCICEVIPHHRNRRIYSISAVEKDSSRVLC
jgi:hypothetical protein